MSLNSIYDLSGLSNNPITNQPTTNKTGGITGKLLVGYQLGLSSNSTIGDMYTTSAQMIISLTWDPKTNLTVDPPPAKIKYHYRRKVTVSATADTHASGQSAYGIVTANCGGLQWQMAANC